MIRAKISDILQVRIAEGRWEAYTLPLDREGKFTRKTMIQIIMVLCEELESMENALSDMTTRIDGIASVIKNTEKSINDFKKEVDDHGQKLKKRETKVSI